MTDNSLTDLHQLVWTALLAALISVGAFLVVPIGPVPVSMQPFFIFLTGFILGPKRGVLAVGLYLLAGTIGLPVFSGGRSGLGHLFGPTGGYLFGFVLSAWLCGMGRKTSPNLHWAAGLLWGIGALLAVYGTGMTWLKFALDLSWQKAFIVGVVPFMPWDAIKIVAAVACCRYLIRLNLLPGGNEPT
ncbi:biotin transporter BioY [Pseudodesulfovibrio sp. JC047]|uniref:biotin transporter BioY n=1 Tax=Pseudodesulfovibrio sp. JC047 TaxID=2683199 RepID=UPI0013D3430F|nr:biotin transporter BioY [Pseudodesulfovibrio sp. JC047]NDV19705.1 biotin transporter BioY [Pseudodesulfovibrio sp. JC047]